MNNVRFIYIILCMCVRARVCTSDRRRNAKDKYKQTMDKQREIKNTVTGNTLTQNTIL